jgi:hypothetical protein
MLLCAYFTISVARSKNLKRTNLAISTFRFLKEKFKIEKMQNSPTLLLIANISEFLEFHKIL